MKRCLQIVSFLLACLVVMTTVDRAVGQEKKPAEGKVGVIPAKITGTVTGIQGESILVTAVGNEKWIIQTNTREFRIKAKVTVEGTAVIEALRRGTYVRFTADVDKRGNIQGELAELEIFTPSESAKPGLYSNDGGEAREGRKPAVSNYLIAGQVSSFRRGRLTLV
ncbi:MAG: hypothetical protein IIA67_10580, partial [Planctomycetes bacterium]|nr:hypothetical protein [Planctomycetota bacterium]